MNKPDYKAMSRAELKAYVLSHHEDAEAIRELFDRSNGLRKVFPMPQSDEEARQIFKGILFE